MKFFVGILFIGMALLDGCERFNLNTDEDDIVASVGEKHLYKGDIEALVKPGVSSLDSAEVVETFIEKWVKKQLLLQRAELNLTEEDKDLQKELDDYRASLLIFKYEQLYIQSKLDTIISDSEIEEYYEAHQSNFRLENLIVKARFIKLPLESPNLRELERWYKSNKEEDLAKLEDYCFQYATKYDDFKGQWAPFYRIESLLPTPINNIDGLLRYNKTIEASDSLFQYYVYIQDFKKRGETAPIEYVAGNIESVLLNKNKISLLKDLENNIYNNAVVRNQVKIYTK